MDADIRIRITRVVDDDELGRQIEPKMRNLGEAMGARMQRLVPKRTWAAHDSVVTDTEREGARVVTQVGAGNDEVDYVLHLERGTSRAKAQPFMRPAFAQTTGRDLNYGGRGVVQHGTISAAAAKTSRARRAARAASGGSGAKPKGSYFYSGGKRYYYRSEGTS